MRHDPGIAASPRCEIDFEVESGQRLSPACLPLRGRSCSPRCLAVGEVVGEGFLRRRRRVGPEPFVEGDHGFSAGGPGVESIVGRLVK